MRRKPYCSKMLKWMWRSICSGETQTGGSGIACPSAGFALLEVMICLAILAIVLPIFLTLIGQNAQLEAMNSETNIAVNAATKTVEALRSLSYGQVADGLIATTFRAEGLGNDGHTITLANSAGSDQVGNIAITENAEHTSKTIKVTVTWRSVTGSNRTVMLMTEMTTY